MRRLISGAGLVVLLGMAAAADIPANRYFTVPVSNLEITDGALPAESQVGSLLHDQFQREIYRWGKVANRGHLTVRLDQPGIADLVFESHEGGPRWSHLYLVVKTNAPGPITGRCNFVIESQPEVKGTFRFRVRGEPNTKRAADWFEYAQARSTMATLRDPFQSSYPGMPWFRYRLTQASRPKTGDLAFLWKRDSAKPQLQAAPGEPDAAHVERLQFGDLGRNPREFGRQWSNDASEVLSGGRAIAENLQLDRQLELRGDDAGRVPIDSLGGITIREFDWGPLTRGLRPALDPLASVIPADQHAVFFPSVVATLNTMQELERAGLAVMHMATVTSTDDRIAHRYQRQLGILNPDLGRLLPPTLVTGVAMTGSDLYFDTGTDTAAIYATEQPEQVGKLLSASWGIIKTANPEAVESRESIAGVACRVLRSPDRIVSAYLAERPGLVILANSPVQIRRIVEVQSGKSPALAGSPEYIYFRDRYRRTDADESAFAMLPDAAIRRWCGPKWRIAHHRRIMTGSALAAAQASHLVEMQSLKETRSVDEAGLGPVAVSSHGVYSASLGARLFQTPIAEVDLDVVTKTEADAYRQWRDGYQQNWSRYFDPIALRLAIKPDRIGVDLSVMPLIERSRYGELVSVSAGAKLPPSAGDPHPESLIHFVIGFNRQSESFQETMRQLDSFTTREDNSATVRSWVGDWLTLYADEDPLWDEFVKEGSNFGFWEKKGVQIPVGIAIAVHDADKRAQFQKALRSVFIWDKAEKDSHEYKGVPYLEVRHTAIPVFYSLVLPEQWLLSPSEKVVRRAIERHLARKEGKSTVPPNFTWAGDSLGFAAKAQASRYLHDFMFGSSLYQIRGACWANLPILNEWHALDPSGDPVAFHEKWWGERLVCPAGGKYVWNAEDGTMESTILGHPGRPKEPQAIESPFIKSLRDAQMGVTFEMNGLRARLDLRRAP